MKEVKYIPGDLVMFKNKKQTIIISFGWKHYVLTCHKTVADAVHYTNIYPIPLTPKILEDNGWKLARQGIDDEKFEYFEYEKGYEYPVLTFYPRKGGQNMSLSVYIKGRLIVDFIQYCHQLQHLLFGLGLNSELKV